jgi:predicted nucleic acid-binding protein
MVYFDTNVLLYAFIKNVDNEKQRDISIALIEKAIYNDTLIVSEVILCEFAFVSKKLNEDKGDIDNNLEFFSTFLHISNLNINQRMMKILRKQIYILVHLMYII